MRVESAEQGVRFEWAGEPATVVKVGLSGTRERNYERLALLHEVVRSQRHGGVAWVDLEMRERTFTGQGGNIDLGAPRLLVWTGDFHDWQTAAMAFTVLCRAVGMDDDGVELEVTV